MRDQPDDYVQWDQKAWSRICCIVRLGVKRDVFNWSYHCLVILLAHSIASWPQNWQRLKKHVWHSRIPDDYVSNKDLDERAGDIIEATAALFDLTNSHAREMRGRLHIDESEASLINTYIQQAAQQMKLFIDDFSGSKAETSRLIIAKAQATDLTFDGTDPFGYAGLSVVEHPEMAWSIGNGSQWHEGSQGWDNWDWSRESHGSWQEDRTQGGQYTRTAHGESWGCKHRANSGSGPSHAQGWSYTRTAHEESWGGTHSVSSGSGHGAVKLRPPFIRAGDTRFTEFEKKKRVYFCDNCGEERKYKSAAQEFEGCYLVFQGIKKHGFNKFEDMEREYRSGVDMTWWCRACQTGTVLGACWKLLGS